LKISTVVQFGGDINLQRPTAGKVTTALAENDASQLPG